MIVFSINRTYLNEEGEEDTLWKSVVAPETFSLDDKILHLTGITIHTGHEHYVAVIKCENNWYFYDDLKNDVKYIGKYEDMLKIDINPMTHGTLYFYM
jgi:ubiquitin C-terminal hydrolase